MRERDRVSGSQGMLIPLDIGAGRVWSALSTPEHLWRALTGAHGGVLPVDGVLEGTLTGGGSWRYLLRFLDWDDDARVVHMEVRAWPAGGVGTARVLAEVRMRPDGRHAALVVNWQATFWGEVPADAAALVPAVRAEASELIRQAALATPGVLRLPGWSVLREGVRGRREVFGVGGGVLMGAVGALVVRWWGSRRRGGRK